MKISISANGKLCGNIRKKRPQMINQRNQLISLRTWAMSKTEGRMNGLRVGKGVRERIWGFNEWESFE